MALVCLTMWGKAETKIPSVLQVVLCQLLILQMVVPVSNYVRRIPSVIIGNNVAIRNAVFD